MKNLPFVLWMIGFPLADNLNSYVNEYLLKKTWSNDVEFVAATICLAIWFFIGYKLYESPEKNKSLHRQASEFNIRRREE